MLLSQQAPNPQLRTELCGTPQGYLLDLHILQNATTRGLPAGKLVTATVKGNALMTVGERQALPAVLAGVWVSLVSVGVYEAVA